MIYRSRIFETWKRIAPPKLADFGLATQGDIVHLHPIQPNVYRAPEVILGAGWTCSAVIWNLGEIREFCLGCLVTTSVTTGLGVTWDKTYFHWLPSC